MKGRFDFTEKIEYSHYIIVDIGDDEEDDFEDFADEVADKIDGKDICEMNEEDVAAMFIKKYGDDAVSLYVDESGDGNLEVI